MNKAEGDRLVEQMRRLGTKCDEFEEHAQRAERRFAEFYEAVAVERARRDEALRTAAEALAASRECMSLAVGLLADIRTERARITIEAEAFNEQANSVAALIKSFADAVRALQQPQSEPPAEPPTVHATD